MNWNDILDEIVSNIQPEHVPAEYIIMAKLVDQNGMERVIRGSALVAFMADPDKANAREARVVLNVSKIKKTMNTDIADFFDRLTAQVSNED